LFRVCSSDPTAQFFSISIVNDTNHPVRIDYCLDRQCESLQDHWTLDPGRSIKTNISDASVLDRYLVRNSLRRRRLGCLPLRFDQKYDDVRVRISQAVPCPGTSALVVQKGKARGQD
jgi:hypothetical protein